MSSSSVLSPCPVIKGIRYTVYNVVQNDQLSGRVNDSSASAGSLVLSWRPAFQAAISFR